MLIEIKNIEKHYALKDRSVFKALAGIDLAVEEGEMIAVKGVSGAGKSTLLHIIGCLDRATSGRYYFKGDMISRKSNSYLSHLRNQEIGFVLQNFALVEEDSAFDNILVPLLFRKKRMKNIDERVNRVMEQVGIAHLASKKIRVLSGGEKQRVAIARALVNSPSVILADEPTGALDSKNAALIMDIFTHLNTVENTTLIIVTHEDYVAARCKRVITMADGRVVNG